MLSYVFFIQTNLQRVPGGSAHIMYMYTCVHVYHGTPGRQSTVQSTDTTTTTN